MRSICHKQCHLKTVGRYFFTSTAYNTSSTISVSSIPRTFSGIQPTGTVHLGNYLGAVKAWADGLGVTGSTTGFNKNQHIFCIVDQHAITLPQDPFTLRNNTYSMAASLIACGLQPEKVLHKSFGIFLAWKSPLLQAKEQTFRGSIL